MVKLDKKAFEHYRDGLKGIKNTIYDQDARFFRGEIVTEREDEVTNNYAFYATIGGKTMIVTRDTTKLLTDRSTPVEDSERSGGTCPYSARIVSHYDKPLEVLARKIIPAETYLSEKWDILLLRDVGNQEGYMNDDLFGMITEDTKEPVYN